MLDAITDVLVYVTGGAVRSNYPLMPCNSQAAPLFLNRELERVMNKERWRSVIGYEGLYEVSDLGKVKTLKRRGVKETRLLKPRLKSGYPTVALRKEGVVKEKGVHRLVLEAFIGPSPLHIDHINEVKTDNALSNLEYVTRLENERRYHCTRNIYGVGVSYMKSKGKFRARISVDGRGRHLGLFDTAEQARHAREFWQDFKNPAFVFEWEEDQCLS